MSRSRDSSRDGRRVHITRVYRFNAGHRLYRADRDPGWNDETFGKCSYPGGHGHNYTLHLTVSGAPCPSTGWIVDPAALDALVEREVMEWIDHRNLNEVLALDVAPVPTTEVLVVEIWERLADCIPALGRDVASLADEGAPHDAGARLERLKLSETAKNTFEYAG